MASLPTITGISPSQGPASGGTTVLIIGTNLTGASQVNFGTSTATPIVGSVTATTLSVVSPLHASGAVKVSVQTPAGTSSQSVFFNYIAVTAIPVVTSITPSAGATTGGLTAVVTGSNLQYVTHVYFTQPSTPNPVQVPASSFAVLSSTQVSVVVPAAPVGPGAATVTASNSFGVSTTSATFTYNALIAAPVVTALNPTTGPAAGGNSVVITGQNFTYATQVDFGATSVATFSVTSDTSITAIAPPAPLVGGPTVLVTVTGPGGAGVTGVNYTYASAPVPTPSTLTPATGPLAGGNTVTIGGTALDTTTGVLFGGTAALLFTVISSSAINVTVPAGNPLALAADVQLTAAGGYTSPTGLVTYTYIPAPVTASIFPGAGIISGGTPIAIEGSGFDNTSSVLFGSTPAAPGDITVANGGTQLDLLTPAHPIGTVPITVVTPGGSAATLSFSFQPPPVITSISPTSGPEAGATAVNINGAGLFYATDVFFGALPSATTPVRVSDNLLTATSPAGTGTVAVTASTPAAFSNGAGFQYVPLPVLSTISPLQGSVLGGNNVTLTGSGFTTTLNVFFGALPTSFIVHSDTSITAIAPVVGTPGTAGVSVQTAGGTTAPITYTYQ